MILPVVTFGIPTLRKVAVEIDKDYLKLQELISDMFETMYNSEGLGLAAPQVDKSIRLFVIDTSVLAEDDPTLDGFKKVFINAKIIERTGEVWTYNEGCLSIPGVREDVKRLEKIRIQYYDENFIFHDEYYEGLKSRVIQHEYDHLEGILFTDKISPIRKRLITGKLNSIARGKFTANYKVKAI